jgi:hypothetical protein
MPKGPKQSSLSVPISPKVGFLSLLPHLNYKPWFALGEFVDNAIQSALDNWPRLRKCEGRSYRLKVHIDIDASDGGRISVRDNAAGISHKDYHRAFRTAEVPPKRDGLSEFGVGMKSAAFWFANRWTVRSKALGESKVALVHFDLESILEHSLENLPVTLSPAKQNEHYTEVLLHEPEKMPTRRTIAKIKDHLAGIYRVFIRDGVLELYYGGDQLEFSEPKILKAPHPRKPDSKPIAWVKKVSISVSRGRRVHGFAAIREEGSLAEAGFALFRRRRLVVGSGDEGYRPEIIFGRSNDFRYQRVFGELHLEGFDVTHTKDGFQWENGEEEILDKLKQELSRAEMPLLRMAMDYRARQRPGRVVSTQDTTTASVNAAALALTQAVDLIEAQRRQTPDIAPPPATLEHGSLESLNTTVCLNFKDQKWDVTVEVISDGSVGDWVELAEQVKGKSARSIRIRVNAGHAFLVRFASGSAEQLEPWIRLGAALVVSEVVARDQGVKGAGVIRRHLNELLRDALSGPAAGTEE